MANSYPLRVLVTGGRKYANAAQVEKVLAGYVIEAICHGAATGADTLAQEYADKYFIPCYAYPAQWRTDGKFNRKAGLERNRLMLADFQPDLVVAFPGGNGTWHMTNIAVAGGFNVLVVEDLPEIDAAVERHPAGGSDA